MRDVISNETIKEINAVIDEILTNIDDNVRNIVGAGNYSLPAIFSYTNYSGQTVSVHGSTFRHEIIIDNADGNNLIGDICTVIGDRNGIKLAKAGVEDRHDTFANYWDSTFDIAYDSDTAINGYVFDMQSGLVGEGTGQSKVMSFKLDNLEVGKAYTLTFRGKFVHAQFVSGQESLVRICSTTAETPYLAQVTLEKDTDAHIYRIDFTNNTQDTTLYLNFWFYGVADDTETYHSEFIADDLIIAGMNIGIISRYIDYNGKWYPIEAGGGTSDLDAIELTYAEYQQLSSAEKLDPNKIYFITDYPASVGALNDLSDVDITTPTEGQILTYDDTDDEWKNTDVDDIAPTVTEASTRANIATGDTLKTIIGKIKKFFSDLKAVAFSGSYNDLSDQPTIPTKTSDLTNDSGFVTTDEKVTGEEKNSNAGTWYNVPFIGTSNQKPYYNDGLRTYALQGTSSAAGRSMVQIGNQTATGTAGNKRGELRIFSEKNGYVDLRATASSTTDRLINFPDNSGTLALAENVTPYKGNLRTEIGNGTPAAATKTYWENDSNIPPLTVSTAYDNYGDEYTLLFSKGGTNTYGNILKWGYADKYLRILRKTSNGWLDSDWAKMDAGYADTAGKLNPYFCYYRVRALKTTLGSTITGGWYRVCKVEGASFDANFIIHTSGDWNTTAPTNATVLVNTVNSSASITQLGGKLYTNMITKIRLVSVSGNIFWLDVYIGGSSSSVTRDNSQFLDLYGQVHVFEEQNPTAPYTQTVTAAASIDLKAISGNVITSEGGTITGSLTGAGAKFQGRYYGSGDDEGIIIDFCNNSYAGLCLGSPTGKRSVFYLTSNASALPFWRYNNGTGTNFDISHPGKSGTIALTTDNVASATKATQDGDGNTISSTYTKVRTTTDSANYNTALNISAYDATKPIFGYVSVISNLSDGVKFYIPFSFMKDVVPAGTHNFMGVQGAYSFMFQFTDSPRSIKLVQARDGNGNDATTNNTIKFYLYRNY